jgi:hypothetical protein
MTIARGDVANVDDRFGCDLRHGDSVTLGSTKDA